MLRPSSGSLSGCSTGSLGTFSALSHRIEIGTEIGFVEALFVCCAKDAKTECDSAVVAILNQAESPMGRLVLTIDLGGRIHAIHV
jgi:hypothetical protein